ncbi:unnamed protein product, partial [Echinostoma caproni]|uniref:Uncharacterized protein n=1 Tax=Echinostoma caproni TaxID=27848 RepID=A0A183BDL6_9TREM
MSGDESSTLLLHPCPTPDDGQADSRPPGLSQPILPPDDEDPEESEAAQWWYTFWSSSLATIATCCDL